MRRGPTLKRYCIIVLTLLVLHAGAAWAIQNCTETLRLARKDAVASADFARGPVLIALPTFPIPADAEFHCFFPQRPFITIQGLPSFPSHEGLEGRGSLGPCWFSVSVMPPGQKDLRFEKLSASAEFSLYHPGASIRLDLVSLQI